MSDETVNLDADQPIVRFLHESNEFDQAKGLVTAKAFQPHKTDKVTSVFNLDPSDPDKLWDHATKHGRTDKAAKAAAHLLVVSVVQSKLFVSVAVPPPCHAEIRGWPFTGAGDEILKAQRLSMQQQLCRNSNLLVR